MTAKIDGNEGDEMDEFWTEQLPVGMGLSLKLHISEGQYHRPDVGIESQFLSHDRGNKTYVMGRPVTAGMAPAERVGNAQAWYYHEDGVLVLWECYLYEYMRQSPRPIKDAKHLAAWRAFETEMIRRFQPQVVVCPAWEPVYETEDWQAFLEAEGYTIQEGNVAVKRLASRDEPPTVLALSANVEGQDDNWPCGMV